MTRPDPFEVVSLSPRLSNANLTRASTLVQSYHGLHRGQKISGIFQVILCVVSITAYIVNHTTTKLLGKNM
jgi:hypothetical protein